MTNEPASPVCYAAQGDDVYMGFAARDELLVALNELLEAERAGTRVALANLKMPGHDHAGLMQVILRDEARWCAMLSQQIKRLEGIPSEAVGAFRDKALAIPEPLERLDFLNRGQAWVVRKLEALLPRVRDERLYADLRAMLECHRDNIRQANEVLETQSKDLS